MMIYRVMCIQFASMKRINLEKTFLILVATCLILSGGDGGGGVLKYLQKGGNSTISTSQQWRALRWFILTSAIVIFHSSNIFHLKSKWILSSYSRIRGITIILFSFPSNLARILYFMWKDPCHVSFLFFTLLSNRSIKPC